MHAGGGSVPIVKRGAANWVHGAFLGASLLIPLLLFGLAAWRDARGIEEQARQRVEHSRDILAADILRVLKTHRVIATAVEQQVRERGWEEIAASADLHAMLARFVMEFPEVHSIWLNDERGVARASSVAFPAPAYDISNRPFFVAIRSGEEAWIVSERYRPEAFPNLEVFNVVHRLTTADGTFRGMIGIVVEPRYFESFYSDMMGREGTFSLVHRDGSLLARFPNVERLPLRLPESSRLLQEIAVSDRGVYESVSSIDGRRRVYGYVRLDGFPLYVGYGVDSRTISAQWYRSLESYAIYFIAATIILALLAYYGWRNHRLVAQAADTLEDDVRARTRDLRIALNEKERALAERELLFREVHHRVKNNLQIISSLVRLQDMHGGSSDETVARIQAMALVHELLYAQGEITELDLGDYARRLGAATRQGLLDAAAFEVDAVPVTLGLDRAMPFALALGEVVTGALKRATAAGARTPVRVVIRRAGSDVIVDVSGPEVEPQDGLGGQLLRNIVLQLKATAEWVSDGGSRSFRLRFAEAPTAVVPRHAAQ